MYTNVSVTPVADRKQLDSITKESLWRHTTVVGDKVRDRYTQPVLESIFVRSGHETRPFRCTILVAYQPLRDRRTTIGETRSMSTEVFIGVAVSPSEIGVAMIPSGGTESISNDHRGIEALVSRLREVDPAVVVLTEGHEKSIHVTGALAAGSLPVVTISSKQIRDFATALGLGADNVDASLLARFAQAARPSPKLLDDQEVLDIEALVQRRSQLSEMITDENDRLQTAPIRTRKDIEQHIQWMADRVSSIDGALSRVWLGDKTANHAEEETDPSDSPESSSTGKKLALKFKKPKSKSVSALGQAIKKKRAPTGGPSAAEESAHLSRGSTPRIPTPDAAKKIVVTKSNTVNFECAACGTKKRVNRGPDGKLIAKEVEGWKLMRDGEQVLKFCERCAGSAGSVFQ